MPSLARVGGCAGWAELTREEIRLGQRLPLLWQRPGRPGRILCTSAAHCREGHQRRALYSLVQKGALVPWRRALHSLVQTRRRVLSSWRDVLAGVAQWCRTKTLRAMSQWLAADGASAAARCAPTPARVD